MKGVYILMCENSKELQIECPTFEIMGVYSSADKAKEAMRKFVDFEGSYGREYRLVDKTDDLCSFYYKGKEDSPLWFEYTIHFEAVQ